MKTVLPVEQAEQRFEAAISFYANKQSILEQEAQALRQQEEQELASIPWYRRWFYTLDDFTGFAEDVKALKAREHKEYCERQLRILQLFSPLSRVTLSQRDLSILEQTND